MRIPTRLITLATAAAAAASLTLVGAGAAQAETQVRTDPVGDATPFASRTASPESTADITRLTGTHGDGRLKFTFDLADLTPDEFVNTTARFASPGGRDYSVTLTRIGSDKIVSLVRNDGDRGEQGCVGLSGSVLNAKDRIIISVPRSCVANPRSVRFGGGTLAGGALRRGIPSASYYGDDARRTGDAGGQLKLGTRQLGNN